MNYKRRPTRLILIIFFLIALGLSSCASELNPYPKAWIDYPHEGAAFQPGTSVSVLSHGFAREGVAEIVLSVNGEAYRRDVPAEAGDDFVSVQQDWIPVETGIYTLLVQVYDIQGQISNPARVTVKVVEKDPTPVVTDTPVITVTPLTPTDAPPTPTPTDPPPTPKDTTPPPVPSPAVPADGLELSCRTSQTLAWLPVTDLSGIAGYYVKLELKITQDQWQSAGEYGPITGKQVDVNVQCGGIYRWMVRAKDGAGNISDWSAPSHFSISLD